MKIPLVQVTSPNIAPGQTASRILIDLIQTKRARVGVVGLGYVGLPLALKFSDDGYHTVGFEIDEAKVHKLNEGRTHSANPQGSGVVEQLAIKRFKATSDFSELTKCDCIIVCVPTPLTIADEPDLGPIRSAVAQVKQHLRHGQLVVLESTTYPGCTDEVVLADLLQSGLELDKDFLVAFSPERVDPGNVQFDVGDIPRIVGGCSPNSAEAAKALYGAIAPKVQVVSSTRVAETAKLLENTFRAVNVGLINEMALMCHRMNIDIWEVIEAARTKPYGFMAFYPGPGIGGHCIPVDPAYLAWKARQFGAEARFITTAQQINDHMPGYVVQLAADALNEAGKALRGSRVLLVGVAYKQDVDDIRESPAIDIIQLLRGKKAKVSYHDPFVEMIDFSKIPWKLRGSALGFGPERRDDEPKLEKAHKETLGGQRATDPLASVELSESTLQRADCVVIVTAHTQIDYQLITQHAPLIVDTRNALGAELRRHNKARIVRL